MTDQVLSGRDLLAPEARVSSSQSGLTVFLVVLALIGAALGAISVTPATMGVWLIGAACLCAILARIAQAGAHHAQQQRGLTAGRSDPAR